MSLKALYDNQKLYSFFCYDEFRMIMIVLEPVTSWTDNNGMCIYYPW